MGLIAAGIEAQRDRPPGRHLRAPGGADLGRGPRPVSNRSRARSSATSAGTLAEQISQKRVTERRLEGRDARWNAPRLRVVHSAPQAPAGAPRSRLFQRQRRLQRRRTRVRHHDFARSRDAGAVGERAGEPALRHRGVGERPGLHLERERPRVPAHALGQRCGERGERRSLLPARRGERRSSGRRRRCPAAGRRPTSRGTASATASSSIPRTASAPSCASTWTSRRRSSFRC